MADDLAAGVGVRRGERFGRKDHVGALLLQRTTHLRKRHLDERDRLRVAAEAVDPTARFDFLKIFSPLIAIVRLLRLAPVEIVESPATITTSVGFFPGATTAAGVTNRNGKPRNRAKPIVATFDTPKSSEPP